MRPLGDRVIVELVQDETGAVSAGGVVLPDMAQDKPSRARVLHVGPGLRSPTTGERMGLDVEPSDVVVFSKYGGVEVKVGAETLLILRESDILAVDE